MAFSVEQKIVMVTGKGGVGKSTVAAALAYNYAKSGKKTLLAELGDESYYARLFNKTVNLEPAAVRPGLFVARWNGESCLREYVRYLLKIKTVADLFFDNKVMRSFIRASPALKELAMLGKITSGIRKWGPPLNYDVIVVDAFATGHYLALLNAPKGMAELIESGPMGEQSRSIQQVLKDQNFTEHIIVTLAEELPVTETVELIAELKAQFQISSRVICNRVYDCPLSPQQLRNLQVELQSDGAKQFAEFLEQLSDRQNVQLKTLDEEVREYRKTPWVLSADSLEIIEKISEQLSLEAR